MKMNYVCFTTLFLLLSSVAPPVSGQQSQSAERLIPADKTVNAVAQAVEKYIKTYGVKQFVLCTVRPAVWGGYDIEVLVSPLSTTDGKIHLFQVNKGTFHHVTQDLTEMTDPDIINNPAKVTKDISGIVSINTKEEAFQKELPFYISDVTFQPPDSIEFTVLSNPSLSINGAKMRRQSYRFEGTLGLNTELTNPRSFSSDPQPQKFRWKLDTSEDEVLSIVTSASYGGNCLISNEIRLRDIAKPNK